VQESSSATPRLSCACLTGAVLWLAALPAIPVRAADGNALPSNELPEVVVVGTTPMGSSALPAEQVPGNVQTLSGKQLQSEHALSVADALNEGLGSVNVNDTQGNPFQLDVIIPATGLSLTVVSFNLVGEALAAFLDPRYRRGRP